MKILLYPFALLIAGCSTTKMVKSMYGDQYSYDYNLTSPAIDTGYLLHYQDTSFAFDFTITDKEIDFTAENKSPETAKIIWDEASLVQFGKAQKVMHKGVKYVDRNSSMPPSVIPPKAKVDDMAVPSENIYYREGYYGTYTSTPGAWETRPLFIQFAKTEETKKAVQNTVGQEITLYLPIKTAGGKDLGYTFTFKVVRANCINCSTQEKK